MGVRTALKDALASRDEIAADEERDEARRQSGCSAIGSLPDRRRVQVSGVVRSVTLRPREGVPAFAAELFDGTGSLDLVWLGRRRIAGIEPGARLKAEGLVCASGGRPTVFNPRYELRARHGE
jgi:hypothetical protein